MAQGRAFSSSTKARWDTPEAQTWAYIKAVPTVVADTARRKKQEAGHPGPALPAPDYSQRPARAVRIISSLALL